MVPNLDVHPYNRVLTPHFPALEDALCHTNICFALIKLIGNAIVASGWILKKDKPFVYWWVILL
jgi:hypothetical protein